MKRIVYFRSVDTIRTVVAEMDMQRQVQLVSLLVGLTTCRGENRVCSVCVSLIFAHESKFIVHDML